MEEMWSREEAIGDWGRFVGAVETGYAADLEAYAEGLFGRSFIQLDLDDREEAPSDDLGALDQRFEAATEPWPELRDWTRDAEGFVRRPLLLLDPLRSEALALPGRIAALPDLMPFLEEAARRPASAEGFAEACRRLEALPLVTEFEAHPRSAWGAAVGEDGVAFFRADTPLALVQEPWIAEVAPLLEPLGYVVVPVAHPQDPAFQIDYPAAARLLPHWDWDGHLLEAAYRVTTLADLVIGTEDAVENVWARRIAAGCEAIRI